MMISQGWEQPGGGKPAGRGQAPPLLYTGVAGRSGGEEGRTPPLYFQGFK